MMTQNDDCVQAKQVPRQDQTQRELPKATLQKKRILVVDNDVGVTRLLKLNLEQTDEFVIQTENCSKAVLGVAADFLPDLILLDVMMPGVSGDNLAERLRASPRTAGAKIVFLTALAQRSKPYTGTDRILAKPVNTAEVLRCCRQELGL